jgi:hypothetical protein
MSQRARHRFVPRLETLEGRAVPSTVQRPIGDFVNHQGTTSVFNTEVPGLPDTIGWTPASTATNIYSALIDYAGRDAAFLAAHYGINLGTTVSGTVSERPLPDGRAEVSVELHTTNALAWASVNDYTNPPDINSSSTPLVFGVRAQDLVAHPGLTPALAQSHFQVVFDNTAPGAALPDLVDAFILGHAGPGVELISISFRATAQGVVHDPTGQQPDQQGTMVVSQTGVLARGNGHFFVGNDPFNPGFAAEVLSIHSTANGPSRSASSGSASSQSTVVGHLQQSATSPAGAPSSGTHASGPGAVDAAFIPHLDGLADDPLASATGW